MMRGYPKHFELGDRVVITKGDMAGRLGKIVQHSMCTTGNREDFNPHGTFTIAVDHPTRLRYDIEMFQVGTFELAPEESLDESPYLKAIYIVTERLYNPFYGDNRQCECSHEYYRHFDTYEQNEAVGCKYCECTHFQETETPMCFRCKEPMASVSYRFCNTCVAFMDTGII